MHPDMRSSIRRPRRRGSRTPSRHPAMVPTTLAFSETTANPEVNASPRRRAKRALRQSAPTTPAPCRLPSATLLSIDRRAHRMYRQTSTLALPDVARERRAPPAAVLSTHAPGCCLCCFPSSSVRLLAYIHLSTAIAVPTKVGSFLPEHLYNLTIDDQTFCDVSDPAVSSTEPCPGVGPLVPLPLSAAHALRAGPSMLPPGRD